MPETYYLDYDRISVDMGDHNVVFVRGQELLDVPDGTMESLVRRGWAVSKRPAPPPTLPPPVEEVPLPEVEPVADEVIEWTEISIDEIGLPEQVVSALVEAELMTVADVLDYGAREGSLQSLAGIGEATESKIQQAIAEVKDGSSTEV